MLTGGMPIACLLASAEISPHSDLDPSVVGKREAEKKVKIGINTNSFNTRQAARNEVA
jgi:hypothetical protein